jgi:hypothetical protein
VDNVILDLGYDMKVLPKKTWDLMGKPKLLWSLFQLRLTNQHKIFLIGHLTRVHVNIDGVRSMENLKSLRSCMIVNHIYH